jgi:hypothetical protein
MTICAVFKNPQGIWIISDSRLSVDHARLDVGVKISALQYKIIGPTETDGQTRKTIADGRLGFCFAGSSLAAYAIKEAVSEIAYNIQTTIDKKSLSFSHLSLIIFDAYNHILRKIGPLLPDIRNTQIVVCGRLPGDTSCQAFRLKLRSDGTVDSGELHFDQSPHELFGSAANSIDLEKTSSLGSLIHEINRVVSDESHKDVGPPLQIGHLSNEGEFRCLGQIIIDEDGVKHARAGLDLQKMNSIRSGMFNPLIEYIELSD